ncbi:MAG: DUF1203 domain-containing protein [Acetobacteraceae bacterium]
MANFRCIPIPSDTAARFRATGKDDRGNTLRELEVTDAHAFACRHCLFYARPGEIMLLGSYDLPRPRGIYWTPSPIFVHAEACPAFASDDMLAPIVRENALVSLRAYDSGDQCLYDLGHVSAGADLDAPLAQALDDPRTSFLSMHTARPGCMLCQIERHA